MAYSESGKSSDNEENLCVNEVEFAVLTAYCDNEGDVRSVCSFILLFYRKIGKTKEAFLPVIYVVKTSFFSCNNRLSAGSN